MEQAELMEALLDVARDAGLEVKVVGASRSDGLAAATSALCRVRGKAWVVLSNADPVEVQLKVLADSLRRVAGEWLEGRYLPPAVRDRLDPD